MALIRNYEIPGTGLTVENAYHVVTNVKVEKRTADVPAPIDVSRPDGLTAGSREPGKEIYWKAGYIATVSLAVWKDKTARDNDAQPIGFIGVDPSDNKYGASIGTAGMDHVCKFFIDINSSDNDITQAYNHLLTTDYYSGSLVD
jgi:hypothetical protein